MLGKSLLLTFGLTFSGFQALHAEGLDLNPAFLGCLMDGFNCLANTGIPFIDQFFGKGYKDPVYTHKMRCDDLRKDWCNKGGFYQCREAKMSFYERKSREKGTWHPRKGPRTKYITGVGYTEQDYFWVLEQELTPSQGDPYFNCNAKERRTFIKAVCPDEIPLENYCRSCVPLYMSTDKTENCKRKEY